MPSLEMTEPQMLRFSPARLYYAASMKSGDKHIFNDNALALKGIGSVRWAHGIRCAHCGNRAVQPRRKGEAQYHCKTCSRTFDYSTGTVLERFPISPPDLLYAIYTFSTHRYRAS